MVSMLHFYLLSIFLLCSALMHAQSTFGEIRGVVTDVSGAVVNTARVGAKNTQTGESRSTKTDPAGNYAFINLDAGSYDITVENPGFRGTVVKGLILRAREIARADVSLEVSGTTTEVQVTTARQVSRCVTR